MGCCVKEFPLHPPHFPPQCNEVSPTKIVSQVLVPGAQCYSLCEEHRVMWYLLNAQVCCRLTVNALPLWHFTLCPYGTSRVRLSRAQVCCRGLCLGQRGHCRRRLVPVSVRPIPILLSPPGLRVPISSPTSFHVHPFTWFHVHPFTWFAVRNIFPPHTRHKCTHAPPPCQG